MKIKVDVFPADVVVVAADVLEDISLLTCAPATLGSYQVNTARVIVDETHITIAVDSPDGAKIIFREPYSMFYPGKEGKIITSSGKMLAFVRNDSCGCGSRLRAWNPYKTIISLKDG
jgi:hypothetical protein